MSAEKRILKILCLSLMLWLAVISVYAQERAVEMEDSSKTAQKVSAAFSAYAVIVGHIDKDAYDKAFSLVKTLFDLKLPAKYDEQMIEAVGKIAYKFAEKKQFKIAQATLDEAMKHLSQRDDNDTKLLKIKAFIYKKAGDQDKALEIYEKAMELELRRLNK
jgi:tetratricopeptide (TPR) repeat protein